VAFVNTNVDESEHEQNSQNVGVDDSENFWKKKMTGNMTRI